MAWLVPLVGISLLTIDVAFAQQVETSQQRFKRLLDCRFSAGQLIGLTRDQLRGKCGPWNEANGTIDANGEREQLVYIDYASGPDVTSTSKAARSRKSKHGRVCNRGTPSPDSQRETEMPNAVRMHGTSPGAPKGNRKAWKHGRYSAVARRRSIAALIPRRRI